MGSWWQKKRMAEDKNRVAVGCWWRIKTEQLIAYENVAFDGVGKTQIYIASLYDTTHGSYGGIKFTVICVSHIFPMKYN